MFMNNTGKDLMREIGQKKHTVDHIFKQVVNSYQKNYVSWTDMNTSHEKTR